MVNLGRISSVHIFCIGFQLPYEVKLVDGFLPQKEGALVKHLASKLLFLSPFMPRPAPVRVG